MGVWSQMGGVFVGAAEGAWDTAKGTASMAAGAVVLAADMSPTGEAIARIENQLGLGSVPTWLPNANRGQRTIESIRSTAAMIWENPRLVWDAITDPIVKDWAEGRYGEAIGRGAFEVGSMFVGTKGLDKLGELAKFGKVEQLAEVLGTAGKLDAVLPDEFANVASHLVDEMRSVGRLGDAVDAARQAGKLDEFLKLGKLGNAEIDELVRLGKITPEEAAAAKRASAAGTNGTTVTEGQGGGGGSIADGSTKPGAPVEEKAPDLPTDKANTVLTDAQTRQHQMLADGTGYNVSPSDWDNYPQVGRNGTYLTDQKAIQDVLGELTADGGKMTIPPQRASQLEQALGLDPGSLQNGFKVRQVDDIGGRAPRSTMEGNNQFLGPGQHLPGGGPEIVVNSIPTRDGVGLRTIQEVTVGN